MIPSLISGKGCKDNFFKELNNLNNYPMSNLKIDEILRHDKNYIGTFSKDNVPILKIINQLLSTYKSQLNREVIGFLIKKLVIKYFIFSHMVLLL